MDDVAFKNLKLGDVVKNTMSGNRYIVHSNYGDRVTAVSTADLTNPSEWDLVHSSANHETSQPQNNTSDKSNFIFLIIAAIGVLFSGVMITNNLVRESEFKKNCVSMNGVASYGDRGRMYCSDKRGELIDSIR